MFNTTIFHPMVVHFPIALILTGFLADVVYLVWKKHEFLTKAAFWLMVLGTLGATAAVITGTFFTSHPTEGEIFGIFESHETGAWTTLIIMWIASALRIYVVAAKKEQPAFRWAVFFLYLAGVAAVSYTGFLGGSMVFEYMIGL